MPGRRIFLLLPLFASALLSCADLPAIEENRCGNGFIEAGEDCDDFSATVKKGGMPGTVAACNAPGVANQCRFHCENDAQCQSAPVSTKGSGWRCGTDHVCRQPRGEDHGNGTFFEPVSSLVPGSADELFTGDFDGDGRKDVLGMGQAGFDVHYFTRDGSEAKSVSIPGAPVVPAIGKLTTTSADDFTLDVGRGIGVMLGGLGETIDPTSYLSLDVAKRYKGPPPDDMRLFILDSGYGPRPMALANLDGLVQLIETAANPMADPKKVVIEEAQGFGRKNLLGSIPVAFLKTQGDRQRFLLAYEGEPSVTVVDVIANPDPKIATQVVRSNIALPSGFSVHGAAFFTDVDSDGFPDVVVGAARCAPVPEDMKVTTCDAAELAVAYGDGNGFFYSLQNTGSWDQTAKDQAAHYIQIYPNDPPQQTPPPPPLEAEIGRYLPLAIGRLNNDSDIDYVNALGIYVSNSGKVLPCPKLPNNYCRTEEPSSGGAWAEARIADFNANGRADVVGVSPGTRGIDFFNGTGTGIFNTFSLPTEGVPKDLAVGDFDGDLVGDLAFDGETAQVEKDASLSEVHKVFVAFGNSSGAPELPASMGVVPNLHRLVAGNVSSLGNDAASDLVILSGLPAKFTTSPKGVEVKDTPGAGWKVGLALGNGYRQIQAPLVFFAPGSIAVHGEPLASAIGLFDGDSTGPMPVPHADLAAVIMRRKSAPDLDAPPLPPPANPICDFAAELWMLPAVAEAAIEPPSDGSKKADVVAMSGKTSVPENFFPVRRFVEAVPINVDGTGGDELLMAFPTYASCDAGGPLNVHGELLLARFDADGLPQMSQVLPSVGENQVLLRLRVGDIDGDGKPDIAAVKVTFDFTKIQLLSTSVVVLRGKGDGTFEAPLDVPITGFPVDLTLVNADGNSAPEIVVVAEFAAADLGAALFVVRWDQTASDPLHPFKTLLPNDTSTSSQDTPGSPLEGPTALVGGDFDGDGVDDVAVAVAGGVRLFKGVAR